MNSMLTVAPVFFMKSSWIIFLSSSSALGTKFDHWSTERVVPFKLGSADGFWAGAAAAAAGLGVSAGLAGAVVGAAGAVGPPQAASSNRLAPLVAATRKRRRDS